MKEVKWNLADGREAMVTVELVTSKTVDADGEKVEVACCEMEIKVSVDGKLIATGEPKKAFHPVCIAKIGKVGLTKERYEQVLEAIAEVKATPQWQEKERKLAAAWKSEIEYDKHRQVMDNVMGQSY